MGIAFIIFIITALLNLHQCITTTASPNQGTHPGKEQSAPDVPLEQENELIKNSDSGTSTSRVGLLTGAKVGIGVGVVAGAVGTVLLAPAVLAGFGFGAAGVAAGSIAAGIQSSMGVVAAGSWFAACQSAGAAGFAAVTSVVIGVAGGTAGAVAGGAAGAVAGGAVAGARGDAGSLSSNLDKSKL